MQYERNADITSVFSGANERKMPGFVQFSTLKKNYSRFSLEELRFHGRTYTDVNKAGVVLGYDQDEKELVLDATDTHTLVYGATGSLKTRCVVLPTMKMLGYGGESMIINDSKGELYDCIAGFLKHQGYNIVTINFRNSALGNSWNPFYIPYQYYLCGNIDKAAEFANDIAAIITTGEMSHSDPFWDYSAYDCLLGLILLLFRYCKMKNAPTEAVNIRNIIQLRQALFSSAMDAKKSSIWKWAKQDELISASLSGSINAPHDTRASILSVLDQKLRNFSIQPTLMDMLSNNDFSIND